MAVNKWKNMDHTAMPFKYVPHLHYFPIIHMKIFTQNEIQFTTPVPIYSL